MVGVPALVAAIVVIALVVVTAILLYFTFVVSTQQGLGSSEYVVAPDAEPAAEDADAAAT